MTSLLQLSPYIVATALAGALAGCSGSTGPASEPSLSPQSAVVANDCRLPNAQSTQRGCRPALRVIGSL